MYKPGIDDLTFVGFAQATPTLFPFVESQARLVAAHLVGEYALPDIGEMERVIRRTRRSTSATCCKTARHTQQVDYFIYEHDIRAREIPAGRKRAQRARPAVGEQRDIGAEDGTPGTGWWTGGAPTAVTRAGTRCCRPSTSCCGSRPGGGQRRGDLPPGRGDPLGVLLLLREQGASRCWR